MTPMTFAPAHPGLLFTLRDKAPLFTALGLFLILSVSATLAAMQIDPRQFQGESIWLKPIKFQIALATYTLSIAFFAQWMTDRSRNARWFRLYATIITFTILAETMWVIGAATFGTASHFNTTSVIWSVLYAVAGIFAVTLTSAALVIGVSVWRNRDTGLPHALHLSIALGLILTFVLTVIVAGYMSSTNGHYVGVPVTGARVPVFGWSREVGDLRIAHFLATHALHGLPLIGWLASRNLAQATATRVVWASAAGFTALTLGLFAQALMGLPLIG